MSLQGFFQLPDISESGCYMNVVYNYNKSPAKA